MTTRRVDNSRKTREAKAWNEKNHTHFKHLYKASPDTRAKTFELPMLVGVPRKMVSAHRKYQLNLLLREIGGRSTTVNDILHKTQDIKRLHVLVEGANGVSSIKPRHYVADLLATLVKEHKLLQQYEKGDGLKHGIARWRYVPNNNMAVRTLLEVRKLAGVRYCTTCIVSILNKLT